MRLIFLCFQLIQVLVLSEAALAPPENIHVKGGLLTWTPATEDSDIYYTVQYRSFSNKKWKNVTACIHTSFSYCNFTSAKAESENGCVMLRVQAERRGLISPPVDACSRHGDSCTPEVSLTVRPGSMTVYLSRNHSMAENNGDHMKYRIYYGKEGEKLKKYKDHPSSMSITSLEQGKRYCIKVQYVYYDKVTGPGSCTLCEVIPESRKEVQGIVIVAVVVVVLLAVVVTVIAYVLIFQRERIKRWLQPPCKIPDHFLLEHSSACRISSSSSEEPYDDIMIVRRE